MATQISNLSTYLKEIPEKSDLITSGINKLSKQRQKLYIKFLKKHGIVCKKATIKTIKNMFEKTTIN